MPDTATVEELKALQSKKGVLEDMLKEADDTDTETIFRHQIEKVDEMIRNAEIEVRSSIPEYALREKVTTIAERYVEDVRSVFGEMGVDMKKLPIPNEDGTVSNLPRVPGFAVISGERRNRTSTKGKTVDLSNLQPRITHSFRGGDTVVGILDTDAVQKYHGKPLSIKMSQLMDELYKEEETDKGFYTRISKDGSATQSALTIFQSKAGGELSEDSFDQSDESETTEDQEPSRNGSKSRRKAG